MPDFVIKRLRVRGCDVELVDAKAIDLPMLDRMYKEYNNDGMTEPENEFGEFGEDRLMEAISASRDQPLDRISSHAIAAVKDWIGATEQPDDITLVLARRMA